MMQKLQINKILEQCLCILQLHNLLDYIFVLKYKYDILLVFIFRNI